MTFTAGHNQTGAPPAPSVIAMSDGELLVAVGEGSSEAFEELHGRYRRAMLGLARSRLRDWGRAEDAVQDAFASIWRASSTYRPDLGPGAPWVYAVARNAIISRGRKRFEPPVEPTDEPSTDPGARGTGRAVLAVVLRPPCARDPSRPPA